MYANVILRVVMLMSWQAKRETTAYCDAVSAERYKDTSAGDASQRMDSSHKHEAFITSMRLRVQCGKVGVTRGVQRALVPDGGLLRPSFGRETLGECGQMRILMGYHGQCTI
jgi:hypothetical protein